MHPVYCCQSDSTTSIHLADLSPDFIEVAREKLSNFDGEDNIKSIEIANAIDLSNTIKTCGHAILIGEKVPKKNYDVHAP